MPNNSLFFCHAFTQPMHMYSTDAQIIEERKSAISQLWTSLRETIDMRSMALAVAKEIHTFDRDAVDTRERIQVRIIFHGT